MSEKKEQQNFMHNMDGSKNFFYRAAAMQARSSYEHLSVCPSDRPSVTNAWIVTKRKHLAKKVQLENVAVANTLQLQVA